MTKAEMEDHRTNYYEELEKARSALKKGLHQKAVELAVTSWEHIDGMMQAWEGDQR